MKNLFKFLFCAFVLLQITTASAQELYASTLKMGVFKLGQNLEQIEEITGKNIPETEARATELDYENWFRITHDGISYGMSFETIYDQNLTPEQNEKAPKRYRLARIKCKSESVKTKSGIAIGMNKMQAFKILDQLGIDYSYSKYSELDADTRKKGKVYESISIDDEGKYLRIEMEAGQIVNFVLEFGSEGC